MSGLEVLAVVGGLASIATLLEVCSKTLIRLKEIQNHKPPALSFQRFELVTAAIAVVSSIRFKEAESDMIESSLRKMQSLLEEAERFMLEACDLTKDGIVKNLLHHKKRALMEHNMKKVEQDLDQWQITLMLFLCARISHTTEQITVPSALAQSNVSDVPHRRAGVSKVQSPKSICQRGLCSCVCHLSVRQQRALIIFAPAQLVLRCDCLTKTFAISISLLQRIVNVSISLDWTQGMKLNSSLHVVKTVRRTSPGFIVIAKCSYGILSLEQGRDQLRTLLENHIIELTDITPDGNGLLEVSLWKQPNEIDHKNMFLRC